MNIKLWGQLFIQVLAMFCAIIGVIFAILIGVMHTVTIEQFFAVKIMGVQFYVVIIGMSVSLSALFASYVSFSMNNPYEHIRAKVNWLLLGKYHHEIFDTKPGRSWYDNEAILSDDLNLIRDKMLQLTTDLQEYAAAPVFVGEETKEEIIEHERHRIARELHDSVSQYLFAATMLLSAVNEGDQCDIPPLMLQQLQMIESIISNAQTEMRALLLHLRPIDLQGKSLAEGITQLLTELKTKVTLSIDWNVSEIELDSGVEDYLFRIVQEAVSNTLRHAKATEFHIFLGEVSGNVQLKMTDNGVGFDVAQTKVGSYGLSNIKERITSLGGTCRIMSTVGKGTIIDISVPNTRR